MSERQKLYACTGCNKIGIVKPCECGAGHPLIDIDIAKPNISHENCRIYKCKVCEPEMTDNYDLKKAINHLFDKIKSVESELKTIYPFSYDNITEIHRVLGEHYKTMWHRDPQGIKKRVNLLEENLKDIRNCIHQNGTRLNKLESKNKVQFEHESEEDYVKRNTYATHTNLKEKYDKLLSFIKGLSLPDNNIEELIRRVQDHNNARSERLKVSYAINARELLKEIGELDE
jgi:hypothetical protein